MKSATSGLDIAAMIMFIAVFMTYLITMTAGNHNTIDKYDQISEKIATSSTDKAEARMPSAKSIVIYFVVLTLVTFIRDLTIILGHIDVLKLEVNASVIIGGAIMLPIFFVVDNACFWPQIVILRFIQCIGFKFNRLNKVQDNRKWYVNQVKDGHDALVLTESAFAYINFSFVVISMAFNVLGIYLVFSHTLRTGTFPLIAIPYLILSVMPLANFLYLTTTVQRLVEAVGETADNLAKIEADFEATEEVKKQAGILRRKLESWDGLDACGYFTINRSLITSIIGQILTYIIILIEFKLGES